MSTLQLVSLYDMDPTGTRPANKVTNESVTVTPPSSIADYSYFLLRGGPFYADSLVIKTGTGTGARTLVENVDYWCVIDFISASVHLNKRVCVGVALFDPNYSGTLYCTYQAMGGNFSAPDKSVLEELIRHRYTARHLSYEQITNLPAGFAAAFHEHNIGDMVGMREVVAELTKIKDAILARNGNFTQLDVLLTEHLNSTAAHTPAEVGLSNIRNYGVGTASDITAGRADRYVTAKAVKDFATNLVSNVNIDTTNFATKSELNNRITAVKTETLNSANTASTNLINQRLGGYYTKQEVDTRIAQHTPNLSNYYTRAQTDSAINTRVNSLNIPSTSSITGQINTALNNYFTKTQINTTLGGYYTKQQVEAYVNQRLQNVQTNLPITVESGNVVITAPKVILKDPTNNDVTMVELGKVY